MSDRIMGSPMARWMSETVTVSYVATSVTQTIYIAPQKMTVIQIIGRIRVVSSGACRFSFYKVPSGVAVGSGTLLHAADSLAGGAFDLTAGTVAADNNQVIPLVSNSSGVLDLQPGDGIGILITGTQTNSVGVVQITLEPTP
jgi:hypothetical protein